MSRRSDTPMRSKQVRCLPSTNQSSLLQIVIPIYARSDRDEFLNRRVAYNALRPTKTMANDQSEDRSAKSVGHCLHLSRRMKRYGNRQGCGPRDSRFARQSHRRSRCASGRWSHRPRRRSVRRFHWRARSRRAARQRSQALPRQGHAQGRREHRQENRSRRQRAWTPKTKAPSIAK